MERFRAEKAAKTSVRSFEHPLGAEKCCNRGAGAQNLQKRADFEGFEAKKFFQTPSKNDRFQHGVCENLNPPWQVQCQAVKIRLGYLPQGWWKEAVLGGAWRITTAERLVFLTSNLEVAVDVSAKFADYSLAVLVYWNTDYPCPDLRSVAYVITDTPGLPAHCRITSDVLDTDWWRMYAGHLLFMDTDPTGEKFYELVRRARIDQRYRDVVWPELRRRREFARLVGIPYSDSLWYKPMKVK